MAEKVAALGVRREAGYFYFLRGCEVWRVPMVRGGTPAGPGGPAPLAAGDFVREPGYLYFLDADGDVARAKRDDADAELAAMARKSGPGGEAAFEAAKKELAEHVASKPPKSR